MLQKLAGQVRIENAGQFAAFGRADDDQPRPVVRREARDAAAGVTVRADPAPQGAVPGGPCLPAFFEAVRDDTAGAFSLPGPRSRPLDNGGIPDMRGFP